MQSERWCDPRAKLLSGAAWEQHKIPVCRSLNLSTDFDEQFRYLSAKLENTYQDVLKRLPKNDAVEIVKNNKGKDRIKLSRLEKIDEPDSLKILKDKVDKLMPRIDFPELLLETNRMSDFTDECSHISDNNSRVSGIEVSLCAVIMADACNIGLEPLINEDSPQLTRNRLSWVQQNSLARTVYHGRRGEIHEKYREGQEDQLNVLGLATNAIVLWNTVYMQAALDHLRTQGEVIKEEDEARLSPLGRKHINFLGHFSFMLPQDVIEGQLRPLNMGLNHQTVVV